MGAITPVRAILFDLWGTLIREDPAVSERRMTARAIDAHGTLESLGYKYDLADVTAAFLAAGVELEQIHAGEVDLSARGRTVLYLRHLDDELPDQLSDEAWLRLDHAILTPALSLPPVLMPGAAETLAAVKARGLPTALVSNAGATPGFVLQRLLDRFGLLQHLDVLVFSDEVELAKPSAAIFAAALDDLGVAPEAAVFVGDHPRLDVFGARRAGLWMVQIGDDAADGAEPHARIASLAELVPALRELRLVS